MELIPAVGNCCVGWVESASRMAMAAGLPCEAKRVMPLFSLSRQYFLYWLVIPRDETEALGIPVSNFFAIASPSILNCLRAVFRFEVLFLSRIMRSAVPWKLVLKYFSFSLAFEYCPLFPLHMKKLPPLVQSLLVRYRPYPEFSQSLYSSILWLSGFPEIPGKIDRRKACSSENIRKLGFFDRLSLTPIPLSRIAI